MTGKEETGIFTLYSDVEATAVRWLWYPFIAVGKITLLQGDPGDGKSTMMMNLIAELSKGGTMPDGKSIGMPQKVIYQCSEDDASDTIKPRLETCGADCRNVAFINEEMNSGLTLDDERIRKAIIQFRPRLVVIDPIQAYLGSDSDLQIAGRARKLMQRLGMWASAYDCAVVLIGHLNKKEGTSRGQNGQTDDLHFSTRMGGNFWTANHKYCTGWHFAAGALCRKLGCTPAGSRN